MEEIYKSVLLLIHSLTQLSGTTYKYKEEPNEENGEKIVTIVDKCENKFLKVKEEIVRMVQEVEDGQKTEEIEETEEIETIPTEQGFLIKE
jgi:hypothetical protein